MWNISWRRWPTHSKNAIQLVRIHTVMNCLQFYERRKFQFYFFHHNKDEYLSPNDHAKCPVICFVFTFEQPIPLFGDNVCISQVVLLFTETILLISVSISLYLRVSLFLVLYLLSFSITIASAWHRYRHTIWSLSGSWTIKCRLLFKGNSLCLSLVYCRIWLFSCQWYVTTSHGPAGITHFRTWC